MPNSMWFDFRQGNRSEYLAQYILSAIGTAAKVPREEDIGTDFFCSLAEPKGKRLIFHSPFIVQTKSSSISTISYGGMANNKKSNEKRWKKEEIEWLFSQEQPILIGSVDKDDPKLKIYTTSNIWSAFYLSGKPGEIILKLDFPKENNIEIPLPKGKNDPKLPKENGVCDGKKWTVPLGPPVVTVSINDTENKKRIGNIRDILTKVLRIEQENITYRRLNVHVSSYPKFIFTNKNVSEKWCYSNIFFGNSRSGQNTNEQLKAISPIICTLALNYQLQGKQNELKKIKSFCKLLPEGPELRILKEKVPELFS